MNLPRNYIASIAIDIKRMILGNAGKSIAAKNKVSRPYGPPVFVWAGPYEMAFRALQKSKKSCIVAFFQPWSARSQVFRVWLRYTH